MTLNLMCELKGTRELKFWVDHNIFFLCLHYLHEYASMMKLNIVCGIYTYSISCNVTLTS